MRKTALLAAFLLAAFSIGAIVYSYRLYIKKRREILITGCARSGTTYITKVLKQCGYRVGHENRKKDGVCSWLMAVDTRHVPWGQARNGYRFRHIFHQVRDPLKTISSLNATEPEVSFQFIQEHIPEIQKEDSRLTQCAKFWYYWNLLAESQAEWTYRIEALEEVWGEFERRLGKKLDKNILKAVPKTTNTRGSYSELTWEELKKELEPSFYQKLQELAKRYGYL